jgi:uncharacterized membrane-anchored protein
MRKVAEVNFIFWIMKICATTLGETAGDMLSMTLSVGYSVSSIILISFFIVTLITQLRSKVSSYSVLVSYNFHQYGRNYYVGLYG